MDRGRRDYDDKASSAATKALQSLPDKDADHMTDNSDTIEEGVAPSPQPNPVYGNDEEKNTGQAGTSDSHAAAPGVKEGPVSSRTRSKS